MQNDYSQFQRELALQPVAAAPAPVLAAQALSVSGPVLPAHQAARVTSVLHGQPTSGGVTGSQLVSSQSKCINSNTVCSLNYRLSPSSHGRMPTSRFTYNVFCRYSESRGLLAYVGVREQLGLWTNTYTFLFCSG